jgi:hypothetical protein
MVLVVETVEEEEEEEDDDEEGVEAGIFGADPFDLRFGAVLARFVLDFDCCGALSAVSVPSPLRPTAVKASMHAGSATWLEIVSVASVAKKAIDRVEASSCCGVWTSGFGDGANSDGSVFSKTCSAGLP